MVDGEDDEDVPVETSTLIVTEVEKGGYLQVTSLLVVGYYMMKHGMKQ